MHTILPSLILACAPLAAAQELTYATLDPWREYLLPAAGDEAWRALGWRASFWEGVREARETRRPVLLWAMNGHPLGCT